MWSFGCILTELFTGYPLFPGENENEQLACIMEIFGAPNIELQSRGSRRRHFFDSSGNPKIVTNSKGERRRPSTKSLTTTIGSGDALFLDFIKRCLEWDPLRRMTAQEGLYHPWITQQSVNELPRLPSSSSIDNSLSPGGLVGSSMRLDSHPKLTKHVQTSTYSPRKPTTSSGTLPDVSRNYSIHRERSNLGRSNGTMKASTSSGHKVTLGRIKPPIVDRLRGVDAQVLNGLDRKTGLPPISLSQPVLSSSKNSGSLASLDRTGRRQNVSMESLSREIPVSCHFIYTMRIAVYDKF